jgi:hypothetical protein
MQTFMPSENYAESARVLDNKRLHKQALEGWQILMNLLEVDPDGNPRSAKGWRNHPAVKMWRGYEYALHEYVQVMVAEWKRRGYKSTIDEKAAKTIALLTTTNRDLPPWLNNKYTAETVTSTHRQALLAKNYDWYKQFGWEEDYGQMPESYEYYWPVD